MESLSGQVVRGYELRELIGVGGFGEVWRAYQPAVKRDVAIKIILPQYANQPDFIRSFETEAQLIARLEHLHIVPLYDYWREPGGAYLVMRWLRGGSLRQRLLEGPINLETAATLMDQTAGALTVAHRRGVVHRDIKPDNILLDEEGNFYLTDFGIAQDLEGLQGNGKESDVFAGSLTYTSPEQIRGEIATPLTDIYSLGVLLYESLTGEHPFPDAAPSELVFKHLSEPVPLISERFTEFSPEIDAVIQRATAKVPADRYPDAATMASAFRRSLKSAKRRTLLLEGVQLGTQVMDTTPTPFDHILPEIETPYKGLRAFQEADAAEFFGREALVEQLLARLAEANTDTAARFLAVVGPSGSGKSSVIKAGLIPALRGGALPGSKHWFIVEMLPGSQPYHELEAALLRVATSPPDDLLQQLVSDERGLTQAVDRVLPASDDGLLFLYIDQFEELFTLVENEDLRAKFLKSLWLAVSEPNSRLRLVVTLRADFYDRPLMYPGFGDLVRRRTEVVLPLTMDELQRAIIEPALRVGVDLEPGLVSAIMTDVSEQPGALPLLQYALTELFERRDGRILRLETYHAIGGVLGALARRAEELYDGLSDAGKQATRQLFLRLVALTDGTESTRRRVSRSEVVSLSEDEATMESVIDAFGKFRLLTFDRDPATRAPTLEVAHEALIRQWNRLRGWIAESREDIQHQRRLAAAAEDWINSGRDPSFLARGIRLEQFEGWAATTTVALNQTETSYIRASVAAREARQMYEEAQRRREALLERRSRNTLRGLVLVLFIGLVAAMGLTAVALNQSDFAQRNAATATFAEGLANLEAANAMTQAAIAELNAVEARSLALAASSQLALRDGNRDLAVLLALEANRIASPQQARLALADVDYSPGTQKQMGGNTAAVVDVAMSPDQRRIVSGSRDGRIIVWNAITGEIIHDLRGHSDRVTSVSFSSDNTLILSGSWDGTARIWDAETGEELKRFTEVSGGVLAAAFSPGGRSIVIGSSDGTLRIWDTETGTTRRRLFGHTGAITSVAFAPDSTKVLSGSMDRTARVWSVASGNELLRLEDHGDRVTSVAFDPTGRLIATGSNDNFVRLWSAVSGQQIREFAGHTDSITEVAFDPSGRTLLTSSWDESMILWNLNTGQQIARLLGHRGAVNSATFSTDGHLAVSGSDDRMVRVWELNSGTERRRLRFYVDDITALAVSPEGRTALVGGSNNSFVMFNVITGQQIRRFFGHRDSLVSVAISPDGNYGLTSALDRAVILWDLNTGEEIRRFEGHTDIVSSVDFDVTGRHAVTGSWDRTLIIWDVQTGEIVYRLEGGHADRVSTVAYTMDSHGILSGANDGTIALWDADTGELIRWFGGLDVAITQIAISPDTYHFMTASSDGILRLWDLTTGQEVRQFVGHRSAALTVAISPDGSTAISGSRDRSLILWDIASGAQIYRFEGHTDAVTHVSFIRGGLAAISGSRDRTLRQWRTLSLNNLVDWTYDNRYIPEVDCEATSQFRVELLCEVTPTRTPRPRATP